MRFVKGVLALATLVAAVVVMPWAISTVGQLPDPGNWAGRGLADILLSRDDGTVLISVLTVAAWIAWGVFTVCVLAELAAIASRHRWRPTLPGLRLPQAVAAGLIVAVAAMFVVQAALPRGVPAHPPSTAPVAVVQAATPPAMPSTPTAGAATESATTESATTESATTESAKTESAKTESAKTESAPTASAPVTDPPTPVRWAGHQQGGHQQGGHQQGVHQQGGHQQAGQRVHIVVAGEDLWSIAAHYYGEGAQWRTIAQANAVLLTRGPDHLEVGWRLVIPAAGSSTGPHVVVRPGDTLSGLAQQHLGDADRWSELYAANRTVISDPDLILPGMVLAVPERGQDSSAGSHRDEGQLPGDPREQASDSDAAGSPEEGQLTGNPADGSAWEPVASAAEPVSAARALDAPAAPDGDARPELSPQVAGKPDAGQWEVGQLEVGQQEESPGAQGRPGTAVPDPADTPGSAESEVDPQMLAAGVGGLLAAGALTGVAGRRLWQLRQRPVGRRLPTVPGWASDLERSLGHQQDPESLRALDKAMQLIADHCLRTGEDLPRLVSASVGPTSIELEMRSVGGTAPAPFTVGGRIWIAALQSVLDAPEVDAARPWPATVSLGTRSDGAYVLVNLEEAPLLDVHGEAETVRAVQTALAMELAVSLWAAELQLVLVADGPQARHAAGWAEALDIPQVAICPSVTTALDHLERRADHQRRVLAGAPWFGPQRLAPETAEAWTPEVMVFLQDLSAHDHGRLSRALQTSPVSMAAVTVGGDHPIAGPGQGIRMTVRPERALLAPAGVQFVPQFVDDQVRDGLRQLLITSGSAETTPAPWWRAEEDVSATGAPRLGGSERFASRVVDARPVASALREPAGAALASASPARAYAEEVVVATGTTTRPADAEHPLIRLLGPIELVGARGTAPSRAARQCIEYAAFLLENPGSTAPAMKAGLIIAEGTRRSNMSRLRGWLGDGPSGPYLPDAYSGRITLDDAVSSDWQHLQLLVATGVDRAPTTALIAALDLVRGAPLADAAPHQWHWAEEMRTDMVSVIRDIGVELCRRALDERQIDLARWAAARALAAAPGDEFLMVARIRTEHAAGNAADVHRLALQVSAQARRLGVDLSEETITVLQQVIEGTVRARSL